MGGGVGGVGGEGVGVGVDGGGGVGGVGGVGSVGGFGGVGGFLFRGFLVGLLGTGAAGSRSEPNQLQCIHLRVRA